MHPPPSHASPNPYVHICNDVPVKCHIGDAVVVDKRAGNDEAVEKLVRVEKDVHFAREESLGYSEQAKQF